MRYPAIEELNAIIDRTTQARAVTVDRVMSGAKVLAFRELIWKFSLPVFIGDTIHVEARVTDLKLAKRLGGGAVTFDIRVINQDGKVVQSGQWVLLVASKRE